MVLSKPAWYGRLPVEASVVGDQVRNAFVAKMLSIGGDVRLLWLPKSSDTTTTTDASRNARVFTYNESLASFDTLMESLGSGRAVVFNGTDEEADVPDNDDFSFGDGEVDQPFSIVALVSVTADANIKTILSKYDLTTGSTAREWVFYLDTSEQPRFRLFDESASAARISRFDATAMSGRHILAATYDGSGASTGLRIYLDAARVDDSDDNNGTYTAMENTAALLRLGATEAAGGGATDFWNGTMSLVMLCAKALSQDEVWAIKEAANGFFDLTL
jgi:hypothetical protein